MKHVKKPHPPKERLIDRLYHEQDGKCAYCGDDMLLERSNDRKQASVEHIIPRARGGLTRDWNVVAACRECNQKKGDKSLLNHLFNTLGDKMIHHPLFSHPALMEDAGNDTGQRTGIHANGRRPEGSQSAFVSFQPDYRRDKNLRR